MIRFVINHLWQSSCFVLVAELLAFVLRSNSPKVRYWVWLSGSLKFLIPFVLLVSLGSVVPRPARHPVSVPAPPFPNALVQVAVPFSPAPDATVPAHASLHWMPAAIGIVWALGFLAVLLARCRSWWRVRAAVRAGTPIDLPVEVRALITPGVLEPSIIGFVRPILVLPAQLLQHLNPRQLDAILMHEMCHVRRRDNLFAAVHMVVEAIFWFHPLVWWVGSRMVKERELACDEEVLRMGFEPADYVEGLLRVCRFYTESPLPCISGVTGADVKKRLRAILAGRVARELNAGKKAMLTAIGLTALALPILIGAVFEVADVHVSNTQNVPAQFSGNAGSIIRDGKYINRDATMLDLIREAYGVTTDSIAGGPGWVSADLFDVIAKVPEGATQAQIKEMLQALLVERFHLVVKNDTHAVPRYVLSVAPGGSKLKPTSGPGDPGCHAVKQAAPLPTAVGEAREAPVPTVKVACHNLTSQQIAENLRQMAGGYLDHDVIDTAKLEGAWDFDLEWSPATAIGDKSRGGISLFDAVEKQLGLKLELKKVPLPALVIASVDRKPAGNPPGISKSLGLAVARFEAASIKMGKPEEQGYGIGWSGGSQVRAHGTLRELIAMTMQIRINAMADLIVGLPKSADSQKWEITAKLPATGEGALSTGRGRPAPPPFSVALEMMRGLLADQFELKTHTENREITVFALMVDGKPKMIRADDSERERCWIDPMAPRPFPNLGFMDRCENTTMVDWAENLETAAGYLDHPVVDATGLEGGWDFVFGFTPTRLQHPLQPVSATTTVPEAPDAPDISIFEALQKELGLKLVKQKRSIPVTVVDHVDEKPLQ